MLRLRLRGAPTLSLLRGLGGGGGGMARPPRFALALALAAPPPHRALALSSASGSQPHDDDCFLPWLRSKAGTYISSQLSIGTSPFGRSLFASAPIHEGDCIMEIPYHVQLTQDKLPRELHMLLDNNAVGDTTKIAVLLMMAQHLVHESGWDPYIKSLPCKDQMHNMMFWNPNELYMIRSSSVCIEAIKQKDQAKEEFSALMPVLKRFPHLFGEIKLDDFMHASALVSSRAWRTSRGVSLIFLTMMVFLVLYYYTMSRKMFPRSLLTGIMLLANSSLTALRYLLCFQVMIRYGKYSNAALALNFGFTLPRNIYDQAHIWIDMPEQDPLYRKKLDMWRNHHHPKSEDASSFGCTRTFAIKGTNFSRGKGTGIPPILRAFIRVFCVTSLEELEEMAMEAAENDGRLGRRPLKNVEREIYAHRKLLVHLEGMIQDHSTAIKGLENIAHPACRSVHPLRKEMARDLLVGELRVLQSARAWVANYCGTLNIS